MNKVQFTKVVRQYSGSSVKEAEDILLLKQNFPFSQVLQALGARVSKDHGFSHFQQELQSAAVYAADRGALKAIMSGNHREAEALSAHHAITDANQPAAITSITPVQITDNDSLAAEVISDLEKLSQLKHNFEMMFQAQTTPALETSVDDNFSVDKTESKETKSKKERIIDLAKAATTFPNSIPIDLEPPKIKGRRRKREDGEDIIDEIVISKQELSPESEKHKQQIEIIDHFIKVQPSILNAKEKQMMQSIGDLSTTKTGEFGDNIISETLVEILLKQGKKDKAIEVLKKLIWKFPQKKAYFASQIEELKK